jgi:hypothetical protein
VHSGRSTAAQLTAAQAGHQLGTIDHGRDRTWHLFTALLGVQGLYYLATGVWPLVSIETFQIVTGYKTDNLVTGREADHWLVMTVGVLVTAIALTLLVAAWRGKYPVEMVVLAVTSSLGLIGLDVIYVAREVIPPIYLADAALEIVLIAAWILALVRRPSGTT